MTINILFSLIYLYVSLSFTASLAQDRFPNSPSNQQALEANFARTFQKAKKIVDYCQTDYHKMSEAVNFLKKELSSHLNIPINTEQDWIPATLMDKPLTEAKELLDHSFHTIERYCQGYRYIELLIRDAQIKREFDDESLIDNLYSDLRRTILTWKAEYKNLHNLLAEAVIDYKETKIIAGSNSKN